MNRLIEQLEKSGIAYECDLSLSKYTTFRVGGTCPLAVFPVNAEECAVCLELIKAENVPFFVLGNGSNILASDNGFDGVILLTERMRTLECEGTVIRSGAGITLSKLCAFALENSLAGAEFAWGIPGSVGGAVYMNAGAYGGEIKDIIKSCTFIDADGNVCKLPLEELDLSYRHSRFTDSGNVILEAEFSLKEGNKDEIKALMDNIIGRRVAKQPLDKPSAGSTFKRPQGAFAAALIEQCGLKGRQIGGARVSDKHSGFVVNENKATAADITLLIREVQRTVKEQTGYDLHCEVIPLGFNKEETPWIF